MSTDAQGQATEGQSLADRTVDELRELADARGLEVPSSAHKDDLVKALKADDKAKRVKQAETVTVRFDGAAEGETELLEHAGYRLRKGEDTEVPAAIFEQLTSGDNANLYRVVKV